MADGHSKKVTAQVRLPSLPQAHGAPLTSAPISAEVEHVAMLEPGFSRKLPPLKHVAVSHENPVKTVSWRDPISNHDSMNAPVVRHKSIFDIAAEVHMKKHASFTEAQEIITRRSTQPLVDELARRKLIICRSDEIRNR